MSQADFVVLSHLGPSWDKMLRIAEKEDRTVVSVSFIQDCVKRGELLDPDDYTLEESPRYKKKHRGRPLKHQSPDDKANKQRISNEEEEPPKKKIEWHMDSLKKQSKVMSTTPAHPVKAEHCDTPLSPPSRLTPRERSPTPPTRIVEFVPGRNLFSEEDRNYLAKYLPILLGRQPDLSYTALGEKLHVKVCIRSLVLLVNIL